MNAHFLPRTIALAIACLAPASAAWATDLLQVYRDAVANDPVIASARSQLQANQEKIIQGRSGLLPAVNLSGNYNKSEIDGSTSTSPTPINRNVTTNGYSVALTQPLFRWANWETFEQSKLVQAQAEATYAQAQIDQFVTLYLGEADRDKLDPILDACVAVYKEQLNEDGQVDFKGKAKAFLRAYGFLSSILPYTNAGWERLSIFLNFLVAKLPAPIEEDLSKGILEAIDMDSYRVEKKAAMKIQLPDENAEIEPVPMTGGGSKAEPELDRLSNILKTFNDQFGNIPWTDTDRVHKLITEDIPSRVAADTAYQNAKQNSDKQNARIEHDKALSRVMTAVLKDDTELFKQFMDNESFKRWLTDTVFRITYDKRPGASP